HSVVRYRKARRAAPVAALAGPEGRNAAPPRPPRRSKEAMNRSRRLALVAQLLGGRRFSSQEELAKALALAGVEVTQATLSRDLKSLGVVKRHDSNGGALYELPGPAVETIDRERRLLDLKTFVNDVRVAQNLVV